MEKIEDLIKKFDCWRFWGYCLVVTSTIKYVRPSSRRGTRVSGRRVDQTSGSVGVSQQSSTRPTEDGDVDDVVHGVAVLFPS